MTAQRRSQAYGGQLTVLHYDWDPNAKNAHGRLQQNSDRLVHALNGDVSLVLERVSGERGPGEVDVIDRLYTPGGFEYDAVIVNALSPRCDDVVEAAQVGMLEHDVSAPIFYLVPKAVARHCCHADFGGDDLIPVVLDSPKGNLGPKSTERLAEILRKEALTRNGA